MSRLWGGWEENPFLEKTVLIAGRGPWTETLGGIFRAQKAITVLVSSSEELFPILRFGDPDFLILGEGFGEETPEKNAVLEYIQNMPSDQRRDLFIVWIGSEVKTGDHLSAFSLSVNLVLHPENLNAAVKVIGRSWSQWRDLYHPYFQARQMVSGY